jgi:hypothetical protein
MQWINVKDKLPDCWSQHSQHYGSGYLLGYTKFKECEITQLWHLEVSDGVYKYEWEGSDGADDYITHWMSLPKPPKI